MSELREPDLELQQHAVALRSLARDLLRDPHAADDVTQQTLQQAMLRRDLQPGPMGGWLRTVLHNFARQWRRSERRRTVRESSLPQPTPEPSPDDSLARRETLRAVTDAVLQLDEPYQTTVLLRYFEDVPPRAIAQRTETSIATVKSRLRRGLALLRTRLDAQRSADRADWRFALATTFGLPMPTATAIAGSGGVGLFGSTAKVLAVAGVLCMGGLFAYTLRPEVAPPPVTHVTAATPTPAATEIHQAIPTTDRQVLREALTTPAVDDAWLDHPFTFDLEVRVVDELGLPVAHQAVELAPEDVPLHTITTGDDGTARLTWRARQASGSVLLRDGQDGLVRVPLTHGRPAHYTIGHLAHPRPRGQGAVPLLSGVPLVAATDGTEGGIREPQPGLLAQVLFHDGSAILRREPMLEDPGYETTETESSSSADLERQRNGVEGIVLTADGEPAPGATVVVFAAGPQPIARTATAIDGRFRFDDLPCGTFTLRAGGDPRGLASGTVAVTRGTTPATLTLQPGGRVQGRLLDLAGAPIDGALVTWRSSDAGWWDATFTDRQGAFTLANLPTRDGLVGIWSPDTMRRLPCRSENAITNGADIDLRFDPASGSTLLVQPVLPAGREQERVVARLWNLDQDLGFEAARSRSDQPWRFPGLPAGQYRVRLFAAGSGWCDAGTHWVDGSTDCDLGNIVLPLPGTVRFAAPAADAPAPTATEVCRLRADVDVRTNLAPVPFDQPVQLPAGDYVLVCRLADGSRRCRRFAVRAGEATVVRLP